MKSVATNWAFVFLISAACKVVDPHKIEKISQHEKNLTTKNIDNLF
jgi:hypothetical protein